MQIGILMIVRHIISCYLINARFAIPREKLDPTAPSGKNAGWRFEILSISKNGCNVFSKVYRVREYARKFQIQDIDVILYRPAGFERTFYSDFTRDLITGGIFIPRRFRRMFIEYRDTATAAFWWIAHIMQPWKGFYIGIVPIEKYLQ